MKKQTEKEMLVLGMMSGTSADGIDTALVRISGAPPEISAKFESHYHVSYQSNVREAILRVANGAATTTAEISRLDFVIGEEFAGPRLRRAKARERRWKRWI